jgi:hypothetical protein
MVFTIYMDGGVPRYLSRESHGSAAEAHLDIRRPGNFLGRGYARSAPTGRNVPPAGHSTIRKLLQEVARSQRERRGALLNERPTHLSRSPRLAHEQDKTARAEQRAKAAVKRSGKLEEEVAREWAEARRAGEGS